MFTEMDINNKIKFEFKHCTFLHTFNILEDLRKYLI